MIGIDFGGTGIKIGDVEGAEIVRSCTLETASSGGPDRLLVAIANAVREIEREPEAVGFAIPGEVDAHGRCWRLPNVPGFAGVEIGSRLSELLGCPVVVENDGTAAGLAELLHGHGRRYASFAMMTLGTGIGGGLVLDGKARRGTHGFAAEIGHVSVRRGPDAWPCACGDAGCLEAYAGTAALLRRFEELGGSAREIREIADSARRGEAAGTETFSMMAQALAQGIRSIQNLLDLDAIVFTGGVSRSFDLIEDELRSALRANAYAKPLGEVPLLVSELGERAGLVGAAHLPAHFGRPKA